MAEQKTVIFQLNNQLCGAFVSQVSEIIRYQEVTHIPRQPRFIDGIINNRGKVIPIINLNKRFDLGELVIDSKTKIIITDLKEGSVGFTVNDVTEIVNFAEDDLEPAPAVVHNDLNSCFKYVGKKGDRLVSIIDLVTILNESEQEKVSKIKV